MNLSSLSTMILLEHVDSTHSPARPSLPSPELGAAVPLPPLLLVPCPSAHRSLVE
jgi:hypothetical protein